MASSSFNINPNYSASSKKLLTASQYVEGVVKGDRFMLGEAITLVESNDLDKKTLAKEILDILPRSDQSIRLAITGPPGVGKSTFIEAFGTNLLEQDQSIAVLAIDPSSYEYKGSILGDKTRMVSLSTSPKAFIRPSSTGALLGGVAFGTKEAILLCEAAGYKYIFIETVGVGQSEFWASQISDFTLCLLQPGSGDDLQGIKRGILESSDIVLINKSDGQQKELANLAAQSYRSVVNILPSKIPGLNRSVLNISSIDNTGFVSLLENLDRLHLYSLENDVFFKNRLHQETFWFQTILKEEIFSYFSSDPFFSDYLKTLNEKIREQKTDAFGALNEINNYFRKLNKKK